MIGIFKLTMELRLALMMRLLLLLKNVMKYLLTANRKMNVPALLNLYDRFYVAGILNDMVMIGRIYGLSIPITASKGNCHELM